MWIIMLWWVGCTVVVEGLAPPPHLRVTPPDKPSSYVPLNVMIRASDGIHLHTIVFIPEPITIRRATVLIRTPYGASGLKGEGETFVKQGYNVLMQDFRGRFKSQGQFDGWRAASTDAHDTIEWAKRQTWCNGVVFAFGTSANGIAAYLEWSNETQPSIHAQMIVVGSAQLHRTFYQGGVYRHSLVHGWLNGIKEQGYEATWMTHEPDDPWWDPLSMTTKWNRVTAPAVHITGWYDIFNQQTLDAYEAYQTNSTIGSGINFLVVLPTGHCPGGAVPWPGGLDGLAIGLGLGGTMFKALESSTTPTKYIEAIAALKAASSNVPRIAWYVMGPGLPGSKGNYWTKGNTFPTPTATPFYLGPNGTLTSGPPPPPGSVTYMYDPKTPVPTIGGNNLLLPQCGPWDQSKLEQRTDVVTFTSTPLETDLPITGRVTVHLSVSSTAVDTDFMVKLIDVFPNGTALLIQDGALRMRWRHGGSTPILMNHTMVYSVDVDVWSTSYIFNTGHRVQLDVSSSNFPRFSVNPNNGLPVNAHDSPLIVANNTIHYGGTTAARLTLPVVSLSSLPNVVI